MDITHQEYLTMKEIVGRYESKLSQNENPNRLLPEKVLNKGIYEMDISVRLFHVMKHGMGIKTFNDMIELSVNDFLRQRNFGKKTLKELQELYADHGLQFAK